MTYAEVYRAIEQLRPTPLWSIGVQTLVARGRDPVTTWQFYCAVGTDGTVIFDDVPSGEALIDLVRGSLAKTSTPIDEVGECRV